MTNKKIDALIIGAGGAGLMCSIEAAKRNRNVLVLDHASKIGGKILISGGGRCNFTNLGASSAQYVSQNLHFCKSALSRYASGDFIQLVKKYKIPFHEKKLGQLFCDISAKDIVVMLTSEAQKYGVEILISCKVIKISKTPAEPNSFLVTTNQGNIECDSLVIATGGLSIPKLGATGLGYQIAKQFDINITKTYPALDGFRFTDDETEKFKELSGVSLDCVISCNSISFRENILFTHSGLSGPAALQASLHWSKGDSIFINLLPEINAFEFLKNKKLEGSKGLVKNVLSELLVNRFSELFCKLYFPETLEQHLYQTPDATLLKMSEKLHSWKIIPSDTIGYSKAEVTKGGVDTNELSSKTMESKKIKGLYFIGEVVDVTGWLGGYNFQWAWSSGWAAGQVV